jgi:1,4-dihydroxy-2-naphthoyl-CoA hydrolase
LAIQVKLINMTDFLQVIRERGIGALDKKMGIEIIEASPERLVATMPVEGNTQPIGLLHGGANVVLAESLGSIGTQLHAGADRKIVGVDINATHHRSATSGIVTAVATAISLGKTLCSYNVEVKNDKGERTCTARITCLILNKI